MKKNFSMAIAGGIGITIIILIVVLYNNQELEIPEEESENNEELELLEIENSEEIESKIPTWVHDIFVWYAEETISENDLLSAIEYLISEEIIDID